MTFSIVAWDPSPAGGAEWGVAVASKFLAVGTAVPWGEASAGAVATQALANLRYGPDGLGRLRRGEDADGVIAALTGDDEDRRHRQVGVVDASGGAASYTGDECMTWAGGHIGDGYCCQGNILTGPEVIAEMSSAFENARGTLAERLLRSLASGDAAGGDRRGRQSAALLVVSDEGGYGGGTDRAVDLRVEDHPQPIPELSRLLDLHRLYFPRADQLEFVDLDIDLAGEVRVMLSKLGYDAGRGPGFDSHLEEALFLYAGTENLEERLGEGATIERGVLRYLRNQAAGTST
ncbi:MAG: DUF1028 domain-containing protein [Actinomycetota bacterium]|nr:DUF1028 domain-containing protein [Actinomycetota bacterium]